MDFDGLYANEMRERHLKNACDSVELVNARLSNTPLILLDRYRCHPGFFGKFFLRISCNLSQTTNSFPDIHKITSLIKLTIIQFHIQANCKNICKSA